MAEDNDGFACWIPNAYEMGLVSSAQMVKFLELNAQPTTTRFIPRALPEGTLQAFIGCLASEGRSLLGWRSFHGLLLWIVWYSLGYAAKGQ
uniref:Uncharacterized protein n=1 Tax=Quercus lobata TaxID=97700 RepID=A0A7N2LJS5_QUELO